MKTRSHPGARRGFTLLELLVAMAITAIIVTVLVSITGIATDTWTRARSETRAARQAKTFIDTLAKDLESLVARSGNDFEWLVAEVRGTEGEPVRSGTGAPVASELTFFTAATDRYLGEIGTSRDEGGDVSCVAYRLRYQDPIESGGSEDTETFVIYRKLVNPDETFQNLLGQNDLSTAFQPLDADIDERSNFVCENVFLFTITFLVEVVDSTGVNPTPEIARVPLGVGSSTSGEFRLRGTGIETDINADGFDRETLESGRLKGIEMSVSVVSDAGLVRINDTGTGLNEKDYARQTYHYSRVVDVPSL